MSKRTAGDNSNAVSLFPFLAVLLCTMGALLVLLVVLAQRAGERVVQVETIAAVEEKTSRSEPPTVSVEPLRQQVLEFQQQVDDELARLTHLEDHVRRLEHQLAKLALANEQLLAVEQEQQIDQQQAERELARLHSLVAEAENTVEQLRENQPTKKSFAIVPYKGPNGTFRQPVFIECRESEVVIQPAGIRLTAEDFAPPIGVHTPLAEAIRASTNLVRQRAHDAGLPEPADPYPLLIIRPDGIKYYGAARQTLDRWGGDFGYEFVSQDMKLAYPEVDMQIARVQQHAVLRAREKRTVLARMAPSRFRIGRMGRVGAPHGNSNGRVGEPGGSAADGFHGGSSGSGDSFADAGTGEGFAGQDSSETGEIRAAGEGSGRQAGSFSGDEEPGDTSGSGNGNESGENFATATGGETLGDANGGESESGGSGGGGQASSGDTNAQSTAATAGGTSASGSSTASGSTESSANSAAGSASTTAPASEGDPSRVQSLTFSPQQNIAESRGANWAVNRDSRRSVPIRRKIAIVVREDHLAVLPPRDATGRTVEGGSVISLTQPMDAIADELVTALREQIDDWGFAGQHMYWRPVLKLHVGPNASQQAARLTALLENSGVDVQPAETASNAAGGATNATR